MHQLIESLWRQHGFTALLVTHDVSEAVALVDRVLLIEDQQITLDRRIDLQRVLPQPAAGPPACPAISPGKALRFPLQPRQAPEAYLTEQP